MVGLDFARAYLDDLLIISRGYSDEHPKQLEQALTRLAEAGLKPMHPEAHSVEQS